MSAPTGPLTDLEVRILEFTRRTWRREFMGERAHAILTEFDMTETRYFQVLNLLVDRPEALAYDAQLVRRLLRIRDEHRSFRSARRRGVTS